MTVAKVWNATTSSWEVLGLGGVATAYSATNPPPYIVEPTSVTTTNFTATGVIRTVFASAAAGAITVTSMVTAAGNSMTVKKTDTSNNPVTVTPSSGTLDGQPSFDLTGAYPSIRIVCDGTNWWIL